MTMNMQEMAEQYSQTRRTILQVIAENLAKERFLDAETRTKLRLGGFPKWFAMYYDAPENEDGLQYLERLLVAWSKTDFVPSDLQAKWLREAEQAARTIERLRDDRSKLRSMRNETSFVIVELSKRIGVAPDQHVTRDAARLIKSRTKPIDYLDSLADVAAVDVIEQIYTDHPKIKEKMQEISLEHLSVMERVCFRAHIEIRMSYGQIADELSQIARTIADSFGITDDVGLGKDSVATHVQNAQKKLRKHHYQRVVLSDEQSVPDSAFDEYERELRRRFDKGLYLKKVKAAPLDETVQMVLL